MLEASLTQTKKWFKTYQLWLLLLASLAGGWLIYLQTAEQVARVYSDYEPVNVFGGGQDLELNQPIAVAVSADQKMYIIDSGNQRITVLQPDGRYAFSFGGPGSGRAELVKPTSLEIDDTGKVFVINQAEDTVVVFASDGTYLSTLSDKNTAAFKAWEKSHAEQRRGLEVKQGTGMAWDKKGRLYVADQHNNRIVVYAELK